MLTVFCSSTVNNTKTVETVAKIMKLGLYQENIKVRYPSSTFIKVKYDIFQHFPRLTEKISKCLTSKIRAVDKVIVYNFFSPDLTWTDLWRDLTNSKWVKCFWKFVKIHRFYFWGFPRQEMEKYGHSGAPPVLIFHSCSNCKILSFKKIFCARTFQAQNFASAIL